MVQSFVLPKSNGKTGSRQEGRIPYERTHSGVSKQSPKTLDKKKVRFFRGSTVSATYASVAFTAPVQPLKSYFVTMMVVFVRLKSAAASVLVVQSGPPSVIAYLLLSLSTKP